jgi:hypothetical protein
MAGKYEWSLCKPAKSFSENDENRPRPQRRLREGHHQHAEATAQREGHHHAANPAKLVRKDFPDWRPSSWSSCWTKFFFWNWLTTDLKVNEAQILPDLDFGSKNGIHPLINGGGGDLQLLIKFFLQSHAV